MVNVSRENRRYGRVIIEGGLRVSMRSIGSEASYNMETRNVSDTGFFLRFEKPGRFPFTPSSVMEVWLTLEEGNTIFFNGKMTRVVHPEEAVLLETEPGIAIRIIQIEKDEENVLREFIRKKAVENEDKDQSLAEATQQEEDRAEVEASTPKRKATRRKTATTKKKTTTRRKKAASAKRPANDEKAAEGEGKVAEQVIPPPVQVAMSAEVVLPSPVPATKSPALVPPRPEPVVPTEDDSSAEQSAFPDKAEKAS